MYPNVWVHSVLKVLFLPMLLLQFPAMVVVRSYVACVKAGTDSFERTAMFWVSFMLVFVLYLPAGILALVSLMLDYASCPNIFGGICC